MTTTQISSEPTPALGQELTRSIDQLTTLIATTDDEPRVTELLAARSQLVEQLARLVDANLNVSSAEYRDAAMGLVRASASIRLAINDLQTATDAVRAVARAIDLVALLL